MTIRDAYDYERCTDHYPTYEKAVVTISSGNHTVPLCKTCLAAFWRGIASRIDDTAELATKINAAPTKHCVECTGTFTPDPAVLDFCPLCLIRGRG